MKKSFLLTLLLLALSITGLLYAHRTVNRASDAVTLTETVLFGEPEKARGLTADLKTTVDRRLFWNTRYSAGAAPETGTRFAFYPGRRSEDYAYRYGGVYLELYTDFGTSSSGALGEDGENLYGMGVIFKDAASRTDAGEEHKETIRLRDYFEYYPLFVTLDLPVWWVDEKGEYPAAHRDPEDRSESQKALDEFFRIPVVENHRIEVHVTKNAAGEVNGWGMSTLEGGANLWTQSALTDAGCYFTFNNRTADGGTVDTSHIPGGYGLYFLPYKTEGDHPVADVSGLSMVYPLDPRAELLQLFADDEQERLLMLTREEQDCVLTVIDIGTMDTLQRLTLLEAIGDQGFATIYFENDLLVPVLGDGRFVVVWPENGRDYRIQFLADYVSPDENTHYLKYDTVMAWDGSRLAMAASTEDSADRQSDCGFYLALYDKTGLTYMALYDNSLDEAPAADYSYRCRPINVSPIVLRFE